MDLSEVQTSTKDETREKLRQQLVAYMHKFCSILTLDALFNGTYDFIGQVESFVDSKKLCERNILPDRIALAEKSVEGIGDFLTTVENFIYDNETDEDNQDC